MCVCLKGFQPIIRLANNSQEKWVEFAVGSLMLREVFFWVVRFPPLRKKKNTIYNFLMLVLMIMVTLIIIVIIMKVVLTMVITVNNNDVNAYSA